MRFDVEAAGRARAVEVVAERDGWRVSLDGRVRHISMVQAGERWSLLVQDPSGSHPVAGRSYDVTFEPVEGGAWRVHVDGDVVPAALLNSLQRSRRQGGADAADGRVLAPMPGRVVKVLVAAGAQVDARQGLVVVEAMKMENELRAPKAGTVREVRAVEGASVEAGAVLVVIE